MSLATVPFSFRNGFFPFCTDNGAAPAGFDYVPLTVVSGDEGFAHAIQLWWLLERITFLPTGTLERTPTDTVMFSSTPFAAPLPDTTDLLSFSMRGSFVASGAGTVTSTSLVFVEPAQRVCVPSGSGYDKALFDVNWRYEWTGGTESQFSTINLALSYISGEWRLYYRFNFDRLNTYGSAYLRIENPAGSSGLVSGTFSLFGLTLNWEAYSLPFGVGTITGAGITATDTYVTPL